MRSMRISRQFVRLVALLIALGGFDVSRLGARSIANDYSVPVVSIIATRPETREPLCPQTCEAPEPAPGVLAVTAEWR